MVSLWSASSDNAAPVEHLRFTSVSASLISGCEVTVSESERARDGAGCGCCSTIIVDVDVGRSALADEAALCVSPEDAEDGVRRTGETHVRSTNTSNSVLSIGVSFPSAGEGVRTGVLGMELVSRDVDDEVEVAVDEAVVVASRPLSVCFTMQSSRCFGSGTPLASGSGEMRSSVARCSVLLRANVSSVSRTT